MIEEKTHKAGFTLVEVIASIPIFSAAMALAMGGLMFMLKNVAQADAQDELDMEVQQTMERLKHDIRLSSLDEL